VLEVSLPRYYQLEQRALAGLVSACEPAPRGPRVDLTRRIKALEREKGRLQRDCDRQQALVRVAQRTLGTLPSAAKPPVPGKEAGTAPAKRRRNRRPSVRALKAVRALQVEQVAEAGVEALPETVETPAVAGT
jgi:predicted secreted Zn-dependent protease